MIIKGDDSKIAKAILQSNKWSYIYLICYTDGTYDYYNNGHIDDVRRYYINDIFDKYELIEIGFTPIISVINELKGFDNLRELTINIEPDSEQNKRTLCSIFTGHDPITNTAKFRKSVEAKLADNWTIGDILERHPYMKDYIIDYIEE